MGQRYDDVATLLSCACLSGNLGMIDGASLYKTAMAMLDGKPKRESCLSNNTDKLAYTCGSMLHGSSSDIETGLRSLRGR